MSTTSGRSRANDPTTSEVSVWAAVVVGSQLLLPGVGVVVAIALAFARLRHTRPLVRYGLIVLSLAILGLQFIGAMFLGMTDGGVGPEVP